MASGIEKKINENFALEARVVLRTADELKNIVNKNPFVNVPNIELDKLHVTFMKDVLEPKETVNLEVKKEENERFVIISKEVYLYCPNGYGRTKLNNNLFEKKLKTIKKGCVNMSHISNREAYKRLEERLNRFPQGAPPSKTLYKILSMLFTEKEAELVAMLPIKPFTLKTAGAIWKMDEVQAENVLQKLASKAIILDVDNNGKKEYCLPPPMLGFFEFSLMRTRDDIDQKLLSELYFQYLNVEEDFIKDLFLSTETKFGKTFVQEGVLSRENELEIMDYDRASNVIKDAKFITVSMCFCRHKMEHLGKTCYAPMETCLTLGDTANTLSNHGYGRAIDAVEGMEILAMAYEYNLVQCGENVRNGPIFLCNCCGCCCEGMLAVKKFGALNPIQTTAFLPKVIEESCIGCGKCAKVCPIEAIKVDVTSKKAKVDETICLGCGVCVRNCPKKSIYLKHRKKEIITPATTTHRIVLQAIDKGTLQELIFDNKALLSHRAMASVLGAILKLPPIKRAMASKQMKSVYLDKLLSEKNDKL